MIGFKRPMITAGAAPRKDRISSASLLLIRVTAVLLGLMRSLPQGWRRMVQPRKSNPVVAGVIWVLSVLWESPRCASQVLSCCSMCSACFRLWHSAT